MSKAVDIEVVKQVALQAGEAVMQIYSSDFSVEYKSDSSPLTQADLQANTIICNALQKHYKSIAIMSEELQPAAFKERKKWQRYWCIDPIDGTKEFVNKTGEFTINIALIEDGVPTLGVVYAPVIRELYYAKKGQGAYMEVLDKNNALQNPKRLPFEKNSSLSEKIRVVASRSHRSQETLKLLEKLAKETKDLQIVTKGSSLKLCMVASGEADIYPRLGPTMEWDTAAGDAIVRESGKMTYCYASQEPLAYNKKDLLNPWFVVK